MSSFLAFNSATKISDERINELKTLALKNYHYAPSRVEIFIHPSRRSGLIELCGFESCTVLSGKTKADYFFGMAFLTGQSCFLKSSDMTGGAIAPEKIHGAFIWTRVHSDARVSVEYDPLLNIPVYYATRNGVSYVSDRMSTCADVAGPTSIDPMSAAWITTIGYSVGERTRFSNVRRAPVGSRLILENGAVHARPASPDLFASDASTDELKVEFKEAVATACQAHIRDHGMLRLGVTGGKDSRLVLAMILEAGLQKYTEFFVYDYASDLGGGADANVARAIATKYDLKLDVLPRVSAKATAPDFDGLMRRLRSHVSATDGLLSGWDSFGLPSPSKDVFVSGSYGELIKHFFKRPAPTNIYFALDTTIPTIDPLGSLKDGAKEVLSNYMASQLEPLAPARSTSRDFADVFYITQRMPNWGGPSNSAVRYGQRAMHPLYNRVLLKLPFRYSFLDRSHHVLHYELIKAVSPILAKMPFANDEWHKSLTTPVEAVKDPVGIPKHGGWQHTIPGNAELVERLIQSVSESTASWTEFHRKEKILEQMRNGFTSAHVSTILGILTTTMAENAVGSEPKGRFNPWFVIKGAR